jgi:hypothetical protein
MIKVYGSLNSVRKRVIFWLCCLGLVVIEPSAQAVSLVVGIPSADTTHEGSIELTHESQLSPWKRNDSYNSFSFATYGVTDHTEVAVSLNSLALPTTNNGSIGVGFKTWHPLLSKQFPKHDIRVIGGQVIPASLHGDGLGSWTFGSVSARLPKTQTRFTAGVSAGTRQLFGRDTVAFMGAIEQPITKRVGFVVDWYSGQHALGALIPAIQIQLSKRDILFVGVKIPNGGDNGLQGGQNLGLIIEFTKRFR